MRRHSLIAVTVTVFLAASPGSAKLLQITDLKTIQNHRSSISQVPNIQGARIIPVHHGVEGPIGDMDHQRSALFKNTAPKTLNVFVKGSPNSSGVRSIVSQGSGFIVRADGITLTNHHVIAAAGSDGQIEVEFYDGSREIATVLDSNEARDIAILQINPKSKNSQTMRWPVMRFADPSTIEVGQSVMAIGNPLGRGFTATWGIISNKERRINGPVLYYQTDAAINPGNSGGALISGSGKLIGMNSLIMSKSGGSDGLGFPTSVKTLKSSLNQFYTTGNLKSGYLGLKLVPGKDGIEIDSFSPTSPAIEGGLKKGDTILAIDGKPVHFKPEEAIQEVLGAIDAKGPNGVLQVKIKRDGKNQNIRLTVGEAPSAAQIKAMAAEATGNLAAIRAALQVYYSEHKKSPETLEELTVDQKYLTEIPMVVVPNAGGGSNAVKVVTRTLASPNEMVAEVDDAGGWIYFTESAAPPLPPTRRVYINSKEINPVTKKPWFVH